MARRGRPCVASSCRISHFGINPVSGGSPPSDNSTRAAAVVKIGLLDQMVARVPIFVEDEALKVRNAEDVIKIYISSARRVSCGAY